MDVKGLPNKARNVTHKVTPAHTIGNSRITFHHFIFRELFLVIVHLGLHRKILAELFLVICRISISCLTSSLQATYVIITSENCAGINFRKDFMGITSKYSRGINYVILAFRMVYSTGTIFSARNFVVQYGS